MASAVSSVTVMSTSDDKTLHPFFEKGYIPSPPILVNGENGPKDATEPCDSVKHEETKPSKANGRKPVSSHARQRTLKDVIPQTTDTSHPPSVAESLEGDIGEGSRRRKRRCTSQSEGDGSNNEQTEREGDGPFSNGQNPDHLQTVTPNSSPLPSDPTTSMSITVPNDTLPTPSPQKKLLRVKPNGKFSSPPSKRSKQEDGASDQPAPKRRAPRRKTGRVETGPQTSSIVRIPYGQDEASRAIVRDRITEILTSEVTTTNKTRRPKSQVPKRPAKATHPFFLGNPQVKEEAPPAKHDSPRKASAVTPGKLRTQAPTSRLQEAVEAPSAYGSSLLKDRLMVRVPGAKEAPFPSREQGHVRGVDAHEPGITRSGTLEHRVPTHRKRKQLDRPFPNDQSILARYTEQLRPDAGPKLRPDGFFEPDVSLASPHRLLITGQEIANRVRQKLMASVDEDEDELQKRNSSVPINPALQRLWKKIPGTMTAFDEVRGEPLMWVQKYAPSTAAEVLQSPKETFALRDWLQSLAIHTVGGSTAAQDKLKIAKLADRPKKKRKKRNDDIDDFIVDSDEEVHDMNELDDGDAEHEKPRNAQKSIIEAVGAGTKLSNAVLLSGPHGCGKTAAAYAVAQELGFKVFEISSSERRSGRDVLDKVGNMTENHQVKQWNEETNLEPSEGPGHIEEAFQKDLESGRQGSLNAFFKPQNKAKPKTKPQPTTSKATKEKILKSVQEAIKKPTKEQQQSVILLEEVDVLFKDDKEFWTTILKLIATSKRACIMICNDETLVPLQAMSLHAILRFSHAPLALATDYLLLLAACEGHLLARDAIESLYVAKNSDLRGSITELSFWCQMGVGDPRGGLGWLFQRWPPGSDTDGEGRRLRVVSDGTYQRGMGVFAPASASMEDSLLWMWDEYGIEPLDATHRATFMQQQNLDDLSTNPVEKWKRFKDYVALADSLSATDACCSIGLHSSAPFDPSQPELTDKARGQFIENLALLQNNAREDFTRLSEELLVTLAVSACGAYQPQALDKLAEARDTVPSRHVGDDKILNRHDLACFDAIAIPNDSSQATGSGLTSSAFDGTLQTVVLDLAPYVRSIVHFDQALEEQRERLDLLTSDGRKAKRARTTRAARSALEGGQRANTRRERWFTKDLDMEAVLATGGKDWPRPFSCPFETASRDGTEGTEAPVSSAE